MKRDPEEDKIYTKNTKKNDEEEENQDKAEMEA